MTQYSDFVNNRILAQINDTAPNTNFRTMMVTLNESFFDFCGVIDEIYDAFDLDNAVGDQLDKIGSLCGLKRSGFSDTDYRRNINIQISIIKSKVQRDENGQLGNWNGTVNNILAIARTFIGAGNDPIILQNIPPYSFKITIPIELEFAEINELFQFIRRALYAGVLGYTTFLFGNGNNLWASANEVPAVVISIDKNTTSFTNISSEFNSTGSADFSPFINFYDGGGYCVFGWPTKYPGIWFDKTSGISAGAGITASWQYWDGAAWTALTDVNDETNNFQSSEPSQIVTWNIPSDWDNTLSLNNTSSLYYSRISLATTGSGAAPTFVGGNIGGSTAGTPAGIWTAISSSLPTYEQLVDGYQFYQASSDQFIDDTTDARDLGGTDVQINNFNNANAMVGDARFIGSLSKFDRMRSIVSSNGVSVRTTDWRYWNGSGWVSLSGVSDTTNGFLNSGLLTYTLPTDWEPVITGSLTTSSLYYIQNITTAFTNQTSFGRASYFYLEKRTTENFEQYIGDDDALWAHASGSAQKVWQFTSGSGFVDITSDFNNSLTTTSPFAAAAPTGSYVSFGSIEPYTKIEFINMAGGTANPGQTFSWEYLNNENDWIALDNVLDQTVNFTATGNLTSSWTMPNTNIIVNDGWAPMSLNSSTELYWTRALMQVNTFSSDPVFDNGLIGDISYGTWVSGSIDKEGVWSMTLSTNDGGKQIANDNTIF